MPETLATRIGSKKASRGPCLEGRIVESRASREASGVTRIARRVTVARLLDEFPIVEITEPVAHVHAEVWAELARTGTPVGAHDLWIGATALTHGLGVITRNERDFVDRLAAPGSCRGTSRNATLQIAPQRSPPRRSAPEGNRR